MLFSTGFAEYFVAMGYKLILLINFKNILALRTGIKFVLIFYSIKSLF